MLIVCREADPDPEGAKLAATPDPLGEAAKLVAVLREHAADSLQTHTLAFEVYSRKGKWLLALGAVQRAMKLAGASHPDVHRLVVRLCHAGEEQILQHVAFGSAFLHIQHSAYSIQPCL